MKILSIYEYGNKVVFLFHAYFDRSVLFDAVSRPGFKRELNPVFCFKISDLKGASKKKYL
jgi:hypothetical protein